jgi:hypothetical protein
MESRLPENSLFLLLPTRLLNHFYTFFGESKSRRPEHSLTQIFDNLLPEPAGGRMSTPQA